MIRDIKVDPQLFSKRWVSYLDLLGFSEIVRSKNWSYVFSYYTRAIERFVKDRGFEPEVNKTWFSDTFLIYSSDSSMNSFLSVESTTRWFTYFLTSAGIPICGAMSYGDFYADKNNNVFFGEALIEAYSFGENQNWIGFIICPSTIEQMKSIGLPADERLNYAYWKIPYKKMQRDIPEKLPAYIIGGSVEINGKNVCLEKLKEMRTRQSDDRIIQKYDNTIDFILRNKRTVVKT